jgi:hypothetical protein
MSRLFSFLVAVAMLIATSCSKSNEFDGEPEMPQSESEIWYTSKDSSVVTPYKTDGFGANIISNTYKNGKGVIKFDDKVTSIGSSAFKNCSWLLYVNKQLNVGFMCNKYSIYFSFVYFYARVLLFYV